MAAMGQSMPMTPPPPGAAGTSPSQPSSPVAASPAPEQPNPQIESLSRMVIQSVQNLRAIAKAVPGAGPSIAKINDLMRDVQMQIIKQSHPGEPAAPPAPSA